MKSIDIYDEIGEMGKYQLWMFFLIGTLVIVPSFIGYSYVFVAATPEFRCKIPILANDTYEIKDSEHNLLVENFIPSSSRPNEQFSQCYLKVFYANLTNNTEKTWQNMNNFSVEKCDAWVYSKKHYTDTIVTQWNLVCHQAHYRSLYLTLHFLGTMGVFFIGFLSDKYGRKTVAYSFVISSLIFSIITVLILQTDLVDIEFKKFIYGFLKLFSGLCASLFTIAVILAIELTGPNKRTLASNIICYSFVISNLFLGVVSYFLRDHLSLSLFVTVVLGIISVSFYFVPESPTWLLANGRKKEAFEIFKKIAQSNRKEVDLEKQLSLLANFSDSISCDNNKISKIYIFKSLIRNKQLMIQSCVLLLSWFVVTMTFQGISFFTGHLAGNPHLNFIISNLIELVGITFIQLTVNRFGRKFPYAIAQFISGAILSLVYFVPSDLPMLRTGLILVAKCSITLSFNSIYTITSELYPTEIRNTIIAICVSIGKIGSCLIPYVYLYAEIYFKSLPYVLYGLLNCLCCLLFSYFIPNNRHKNLNESVEEFLRKKT